MNQSEKIDLVAKILNTPLGAFGVSDLPILSAIAGSQYLNIPDQVLQDLVNKADFWKKKQALLEHTIFNSTINNLLI